MGASSALTCATLEDLGVVGPVWEHPDHPTPGSSRKPEFKMLRNPMVRNLAGTLLAARPSPNVVAFSGLSAGQMAPARPRATVGPFTTLPVGETEYEFRTPLTGYYSAARKALVVRDLESLGRGHGDSPDEAFKDWSYRFHLTYQRLEGKDAVDMSKREKHMLAKIQQMLDMKAVDKRRSVTVRQVGIISRSRRDGLEITWEDGGVETIPFDRLPAECACYRRGQRVEAIVRRAESSFEVLRVLHTQVLPEFPRITEEEADELWKSIPGASTRPEASWDYRECPPGMTSDRPSGPTRIPDGTRSRGGRERGSPSGVPQPPAERGYGSLLPRRRARDLQRPGLPGRQGHRHRLRIRGKELLTLLKTCRVTRVERLILSHGDSDHSGGAAALMTAYRNAIGEIWFVHDNRLFDTAFWGKVKEYLKAGHLRYDQLVRLETGRNNTPRTIYEVVSDSLILKLFAPTFAVNLLSSHPAVRSVNDTSGIVVLRQSSWCVVFPGDAGYAAWKSVYESRKSTLRCDVLAVPHHGGKVGKRGEVAWLYQQAVSPRNAVISVGSANSYGHPREEVVRALIGGGPRVLCTQITGQCCGDLEAYRLAGGGRIATGRSVAHRSQTAKGVSQDVACAGTVLFNFRGHRLTIRRLKEHRSLIKLLRTRPDLKGDPLCRKETGRKGRAPHRAGP